MIKDIVQGTLPTEALPCDENGRPLDLVAASWWDGGFRCVGYIPPPEANFTRCIEAIEDRVVAVLPGRRARDRPRRELLDGCYRKDAEMMLGPSHAAKGSTTQPTTQPGLCPTCGGKMQWKQNRTSYTWFQGCTKWPSCTGTRDVDGNDTRISPQRQNRMIAIVKACILRAEDECLTFTSAELEAAERYELHLDEVTEEKAYILTVKQV